MTAFPLITTAATVYPAASSHSPLPRPLYGCRVPAGFPSPADDFVDKDLDIAALLITNPPATFFVRIDGLSMNGCWIRPDDIAVVDCSIEAKAGMVVIAVLDGEMLIKQLGFGPSGELLLIPRNKRYKTTTVCEGQDFHIWGVVKWTIHKQLP